MKLKDLKQLIIQETADYVLISKPPYISTLEDRNSPLNVLKLAKGYHPDMQVCHRIDKETSGVMILAKNAAAYRNVAMQFEKRQIEKEYHALVHGIVDYRGEIVEKPITALAKGSVKIDHRDGKPAHTTFNSIEAFKKHTLVSCVPKTGRMHQIRIHLSSLGSPIVFDTQYGGEEIFLSQLKRDFNLKKWTEEESLIKRFALHAYRIVFRDLSGEKVEAIAEYPKDFAVLIKQLRKNK